jgi:hypothetical protein
MPLRTRESHPPLAQRANIFAVPADGIPMICAASAMVTVPLILRTISPSLLRSSFPRPESLVEVYWERFISFTRCTITLSLYFFKSKYYTMCVIIHLLDVLLRLYYTCFHGLFRLQTYLSEISFVMRDTRWGIFLSDPFSYFLLHTLQASHMMI